MKHKALRGSGSFVAENLFGGLFFFIVAYYIARFDPRPPIFVLHITIPLLVLLGIYTICYTCWLRFHDPLLGEYSVDKNGIVFFTPKKQVSYSWYDFVDVGITTWSFRFHRNYYVYFSKKNIKEADKAFMVDRYKKRKPKDMPRYIADYVLLGYTDEEFALLLEEVPAWMREQLVTAEKEVWSGKTQI